MEYDTHHDNINWVEYIDKLHLMWVECYRVLKEGGRLCINIQPDFYTRFPTHHYIGVDCRDIGFIWKCEIVWNKNHYNCPTRQFGSWKSPSCPLIKLSWEYIEVYCKGNVKKTGNKEDIDITRDEFLKYINGMWEFAPENKMKKYGHPAMFPEELPYRLMKMFSYRNDIVLDPFGGLGTTALVAKKNGRRYISIDKSEEYCRKTNERMSQMELL
jgi:DNA modification methylase